MQQSPEAKRLGQRIEFTHDYSVRMSGGFPQSQSCSFYIAKSFTFHGVPSVAQHLVKDRYTSPTWISLAATSPETVSDFWVTFLLRYNFTNIFVLQDSGSAINTIFRVFSDPFVSKYSSQPGVQCTRRRVNALDSSINYSEILHDFNLQSRDTELYSELEFRLRIFLFSADDVRSDSAGKSNSCT